MPQSAIGLAALHHLDRLESAERVVWRIKPGRDRFLADHFPEGLEQAFRCGQRRAGSLVDFFSRLPTASVRSRRPCQSGWFLSLPTFLRRVGTIRILTGEGWRARLAEATSFRVPEIFLPWASSFPLIWLLVATFMTHLRFRERDIHPNGNQKRPMVQ